MPSVMTGGRLDTAGEGRRERRLAVELPARLGGRAPRVGQVVDISLKGCLFRGETALDSGAVVDLEVELPDGPLQAKARVAGASLDGDSLPGPPARFLCGLEFLGMGGADEHRLRSFIDAESRRRRGAHTAPS
jgi:hypothetical protein